MGVEPVYPASPVCAASMAGVLCAPMWQWTQSQFCPRVSDPRDAIWQSSQPIARLAWEPLVIGNLVSGCPLAAGTQRVVEWHSSHVVGKTPACLGVCTRAYAVAWQSKQSLLFASFVRWMSSLPPHDVPVSGAMAASAHANARAREGGKVRPLHTW